MRNLKVEYRTFSLLLFVSLVASALTGCTNFDIKSQQNQQIITGAGLGLLTAFMIDDRQLADIARKSVKDMDAKENIAQNGSNYSRRAAMLSEMFRAVNGISLNFKVYMSKEVNAFATPDGSIRIYSGLMDQMNDDELIWVAGHEVGHVVKGHTLQQFRLAYSANSARSLASMSDYGKAASSQAGALFVAAIRGQFSQKHEYEADDVGLIFLQAAGYNPMAAVSSLEKLASLSGNNYNIIAQFISTHPAPGDRANRLRRRIYGR